MGQSRTFQQRPVAAAPAAQPVFSVPSRPFVMTPPGLEEIATSGPAGGEGMRAPEPRREPPPLKLPPTLPPVRTERAASEERERRQTEPLSELPAGMKAPDLPAGLQGRMEQAFRMDFSNVAVHRESAHAERLGALAYTRGNQIHFAPDQFHPETTAGRELIGHELAHVVQQRQGRVRPTSEVEGLPLNDDPALEQEAHHLGARAAGGSLDRLPPLRSLVPRAAPAGTAARPVAQRWIDFGLSGRRPNEYQEEVNGLFAELIERYGDEHADEIERELDIIENSHKRWTPSQVYGGFGQYAAEHWSAKELSDYDPGQIPLTENLQNLKEYSMTERTQLDAVLRLEDGTAIKLDTIKNEKNGPHAEEIFIKKVNDLLAERRDLVPARLGIEITLNNSPCAEKCSGLLAVWARSFKSFKINFFNPHGFKERGEDDFRSAKNTLEESGIELAPFSPRGEAPERFRDIRGFDEDRYERVRERRRRAEAVHYRDRDRSRSRERGAEREQERSTSRHRRRSVRHRSSRSRSPRRSRSPHRSRSRHRRRR